MPDSVTPPLVAALDIGGTKMAAAVVDGSGHVLARDRIATPAAAGAGAVLAAAADLVRAVTHSHAVAALGVGSAGVIEPDTGIVLGATDVLPGWVGTDLRGALGSALGVPVVVRNDVHAHALGEAAHGAGAGHTSLLHIAVGTGVGAAYVHTGLPGRVLIGGHAAAGHAGHLPSKEAGDLPCTCGGRGHLEAIAAGPALAREHARRTGAQVADLREVAALAAGGDADAGAVIELGGRAVGAAIGGLVNVFDPNVVVVGGGVAGLGDPWWQPLRDALFREILPSLRDIPVLPSGLGDDAAVLGAAALAHDLLGRTRLIEGEVR
ncbi:ROK family protein [Nocardioides sp. NPDC057767]|uniref:ROK family protein n=1 Tax=unclassified Nocardioides TaxID=2615069 RepID=UPI00366E25D7